MCNIHAKLVVAWLDGELPANEAADVAQHIERCDECRCSLLAYEHLNETFDAYCDAVMEAKTHSRVPRWVPVLAGAVMAASAMLFVFPRTRIAPPPVLTPTIAAASVRAPVQDSAPPASTAAPRNTLHKRYAAARPVRKEAARWQPAESAVQIAIPADAIFAPGAVPKGMNFIAELSIAQDGSVRQVRLRQ